MGIGSISAIIAAFVDISLCVAALMRNFQSRLCIAFGAFSSLLFVSDAFRVVEGFGGAEPGRFHSLVNIGLGPAALWFLSELIPQERKRLRKWTWFYLPLFAAAVAWMLSNRYATTQWLVGIASELCFIFPAVLWVGTLARAERESLLPREKTRYRHVVWGAVFVLGFHLTNVLEVSGFGVPELGTLARTLYLVFIFQLFIQRELMTAQEVVAKVALFGGIAVILASFYFLLVSWVGDRPGLLFFNTLIASFGIIILFDPIRNFTSRVTRRLFLERHNALERELGLLSCDLMGIVDSSELSVRITHTLKKSLGVKDAALFLVQADGLSFAEVGGVREISASGPMVEYIALRRGRPFVLETVENDRESFHSTSPIRFCESVTETMRRLGIDVVVPFTHDSRMVGFCAASMGEVILLTNDQLRLFFPVSRQIAVILKNSLIFERTSNREKLAAVGELAAGLAHEIKNPLGAIRGAAELLRDPHVDSSEFIRIIIEETDRLSDVVTNILDYAKPRRSPPLAVCDPLQVVEHTMRLFQSDAKIEIRGAPTVRLPVDPEALKQVLVNLFLNAIQAVSGSGRAAEITVSLKELRPRPFSGLKDQLPIYKLLEGWGAEFLGEGKPQLEIEVLDNGPGIPQEEMPRIFLPFHTTKPKGTGLGLAICRRLIEGMGGTITAHSARVSLAAGGATAGTGSRFVIHIPISKEARGALPIGKNSREKYGDENIDC